MFQEHDNTTWTAQGGGGDPDDVLFSRPLGWYDSDWPECLAGRDAANDTDIARVLRWGPRVGTGGTGVKVLVVGMPACEKRVHGTRAAAAPPPVQVAI